MTQKELKALTKEMRKLGVTYLKTGDTEIRLGKAPEPKPKRVLSSDEEIKIKHKVEDLKSVMSLGDRELVDRLFPDFTEEEAH